MIYRYKPVRGFTLIELLVVMSITAMAVALVGGLSVNGYKQYQLRAESIQLEDSLQQASNLAYLSEAKVSIELGQQQLLLISRGKELSKISFKHLSFPNQSFTFNTVGLASLTSVNFVTNSGKQKSIDLQKMGHGS